MLIVVGVMIVRGMINRLPAALMGSMMGQNADAGRLMVRMAAGILLIIPGFFLDTLAILLLIPPVNAGLGKLGQRFAMAMVRQQMAKMFPGWPARRDARRLRLPRHAAARPADPRRAGRQGRQDRRCDR